MLKNIESMDLFEETEYDSDKLYNLFKTTSSTINLELLSKFQSFSTFDDFFKSYINKDINSFFDFFKRLDENYSIICNNENQKNFISLTDKYISIYANLIMLLHLILKNKNIIKKIIANVKNNIIKYNSENSIGYDFQEKLNQYVDYLLNLSLIDGQNKIDYTPLNKTDEISTANITNTSINSMFKDNINFNKDNEFYEKNNEENIRTPYFESKSGSLINNMDVINNNNNYKLNNLQKRDSIGSIFNLPCSGFILEDNKLNRPDIEDNNDIISILNNNKEKKKYNNDIFNDKKLIKSNVKENKNKKDKKKFKKEKENGGANNLHVYKTLLKNINELYKTGNINNTEKIKLKQLIISNSSKVTDIYKVYCNSSVNKYIDYIKSLL